MNDPPFSQIWQNPGWRWVCVAGVALTVINAASAYFLNSRYAGQFFGMVLMAGILVPHLALMQAAVRSGQKSAMWIRFAAWILSNLVLFLAQAVWIVRFFPGWIWRRVDVTMRPPAENELVSAIAVSLEIWGVICFLLWPLAELIANSTHLWSRSSTANDSREHRKQYGLTFAARIFIVFQAALASVTLFFALGFQPNLDRIPTWSRSEFTYPFFTISFTHFLIGYALLKPTQLGWIAVAINLVAWGWFLFIAYF